MARLTSRTARIGLFVLLIAAALVAVGTLSDRVFHDPSSEVYWSCPMHPEVHEHGPGTCPLCGMDLVRVVPEAVGAASAAQPAPMAVDPLSTKAGADNPGPTPRTGFTVDSRRQQLIGVRTAAVERRGVSSDIRAVGVVRYDETRLADVNLKVEGWIQDLFVDSTGAFVRAGDPLFSLYSPDLVTTQNEYLLALRTREELRGSQVAEALDHADRLVASARARLALWDLPADQLTELENAREVQTALVFRAPVTGHVVEKRVLRGQHVTPGQSLYTVADLSTVWVEADVYEREVSGVRVGARATLTLDALPGMRLPGRASFIYPSVQPDTRTVKVRFELANRDGRLRPGMYATVELAAPAGSTLVVPSNALLDSGREQVVFVAEGDGRFEPRYVRVGRRLGDVVEIVEGVREGEMVAARAAFFLDSESQLRASLQAYEPSAVPAAASAGRSPALAVTFTSQPDPPRTGENRFEVSVRDSGGAAVTDAVVTVVFFMPAMPTMNMPAMRNETTLLHVTDGVYRGTGQVLMAGRWEVSVNVVRNQERLGTADLTVVAR